MPGRAYGVNTCDEDALRPPSWLREPAAVLRCDHAYPIGRLRLGAGDDLSARDREGGWKGAVARGHISHARACRGLRGLFCYVARESDIHAQYRRARAREHVGHSFRQRRNFSPRPHPQGRHVADPASSTPSFCVVVVGHRISGYLFCPLRWVPDVFRQSSERGGRHCRHGSFRLGAPRGIRGRDIRLVAATSPDFSFELRSLGRAMARRFRGHRDLRLGTGLVPAADPAASDAISRPPAIHSFRDGAAGVGPPEAVSRPRLPRRNDLLRHRFGDCRDAVLPRAAGARGGRGPFRAVASRDYDAGRCGAPRASHAWNCACAEGLQRCDRPPARNARPRRHRGYGSFRPNVD